MRSISLWNSAMRFLKHPKALLSLITLLALILRLFSPTYMWDYLSPDEARYLMLSLELIMKDSIVGGTFKPGLPMIIALAMNMVGKTKAAGYIVSMTVGILVIPLVYVIGKELRSTRSGLIAALLYAISGPFIQHSSRILTDVPSLFFSLVSILLVIEGFKRQRVGISIGLSMLSGFSLLVSIMIRPSAIALMGALLLVVVYRSVSTLHLRKACELLLGGTLSLVLPLIGLIVVFPSIGIGFSASVLESMQAFISELSPPQILWNTAVFLARGAQVLTLTITPYLGEGLFYFAALILSLIALRDSFHRKGKSDAILTSWIIVYGILYLLARNIVAWQDWRYMLPIFAPLLFLISFSIDNRVDSMKRVITKGIATLQRVETQLLAIFSTSRRIIITGVLVLALILIPIPLIIALPVVLVLVRLGSIGAATKTSKWSVILVALAVLFTVSNSSVFAISNLAVREDSVQSWEKYTPNATSLRIPNVTAGMKAWISQFELPFIKAPSSSNLSQGGLFLWSNDLANRNSFALAWNDTPTTISGEMRFHGLAVDDYSMNSTQYSSTSVYSTGYFTYLEFTLGQTSSLSCLNISVSPIHPTEYFQIDIDIFNESLTSIQVGLGRAQLPYSINIPWISLHVSWSGMPQATYRFSITSHDIETGSLTVAEGNLSYYLPTALDTERTLSVYVTGPSGHLIVTYTNVLGPDPRINLVASNGGPVGINTGQGYSEDNYSIALDSTQGMFPDSTSAVLAKAPLLAIGVVLVLLCMLWIQSGRDSFDPFKTLSLAAMFALVLDFAYLLLSQVASVGILQLGLTSLLFEFVLALRVSLLTGALVSLEVFLRHLYHDRSHDSSVLTSHISLKKPSRETWRIVGVIALAVLFLISGPVAGYEYAMETRESLDSIQKCGCFLQYAYPEGTNILTNENGPWYIDWYGGLRYNVSSISVDILSTQSNMTDLVLRIIAERHIQVVVVFERLGYSLSDTYAYLHTLGYLKLIRSYDEAKGWKSIIYETAESV